MLLLLPNQLFYHLVGEWKERGWSVLMYEHQKFFGKQHKLKIWYHRATMRRFYEYVRGEGVKVKYVEFKGRVTKREVTEMYHPIDHAIAKQFAHVSFMESPLFPVTQEEIQVFKDAKSMRHNASFYKWIAQRPFVRRFKKAMSKVMDTENRKPFPKGGVPEEELWEYEDESGAAAYVEKHFGKNWGELGNYVYPLDREDAEEHFQRFVRSKLKLFGAYQDAFHADVLIGYHSGISMALNIGIITTERCLELLQTSAPRVPLASLEGFLRQIVSWRCYTMTIYMLHSDKLMASAHQPLNPFHHTRRIPRAFYHGTTNIPPVDDAINKAREYAYLHHIERLMVMGNALLLCMVRPRDIYDWFMNCVSIDAYEWVMVPNVYGMSQHVSPFMMMRPYFSSSNYLIKMSHYRKGEWSDTFDALYYHLIHRHQGALQKTYTGANAVALLKKKKNINELLRRAQHYLSALK